MASRELTYLEKVARMIWWKTGEVSVSYPPHENVLWLGYAALALSLKERVDNDDVHDMWSVWSISHSIEHRRPIHKSVIPYNELDAKVQMLDTHYRDSIRHVAESVTSMGTDEAFIQMSRAQAQAMVDA